MLYVHVVSTNHVQQFQKSPGYMQESRGVNPKMPPEEQLREYCQTRPLTLDPIEAMFDRDINHMNWYLSLDTESQQNNTVDQAVHTV